MTILTRVGTICLFAAAVIIQVAACSGRDLPAAAEVKRDIEASLNKGDSSEKIEAFFRGRGLDASYDEHQNRYNSTLRSANTEFHAVWIVINLDKDRRFVSADASDSYTMP